MSETGGRGAAPLHLPLVPPLHMAIKWNNMLHCTRLIRIALSWMGDLLPVKFHPTCSSRTMWFISLLAKQCWIKKVFVGYGYKALNVPIFVETTYIVLVLYWFCWFTNTTHQKILYNYQEWIKTTPGYLKHLLSLKGFKTLFKKMRWTKMQYRSIRFT